MTCGDCARDEGQHEVGFSEKYLLIKLQDRSRRTHENCSVKGFYVKISIWYGGQT